MSTSKTSPPIRNFHLPPPLPKTASRRDDRFEVDVWEFDRLIGQAADGGGVETLKSATSLSPKAACGSRVRPIEATTERL